MKMIVSVLIFLNILLNWHEAKRKVKSKKVNETKYPIKSYSYACVQIVKCFNKFPLFLMDIAENSLKWNSLQWNDTNKEITTDVESGISVWFFIPVKIQEPLYPYVDMKFLSYILCGHLK